MQNILDEICKEVPRYYGRGEVASYIPELAKVNPNQFSMSVVSVSGEEYNVGCFNEKFSIQSISKVFVLAMAMDLVKEELWGRVGREPSGTPFNSLFQLESDHGVPRNPFINAGALVTTDILLEHLENPKDKILDFVRKISSNEEISYNEKVARSEIENSERNAALAFYMKSFKNIFSDPLELIDVYSHHCSIAMSSLDLARAFLILANGGVIKRTNERVLKVNQVRRINSLMLTSGLYDNVGDFAFRVGLPAKSGVGGGIVAVFPHEFSICVWSPELNPSGNSTIGSMALESFVNKAGLSIF